MAVPQHYRPLSLPSWLPIAAAIALPAAVAALLTAAVVNVPIYDEWILTPLVASAHDGTIDPASIWAMQGAHRSVVPTLLILGLAALDRWNIRVEAFVSLGFAILTLAVLYRLMAQTLPRDRFAGTFVLAACLLFSFGQSENWTWGFQLSWYLVNLCVATVLWSLAKPRRTFAAFALAVAAATVASYSLLFGFGAWLAGAIVLWGSRRKLAVWSACAALASGSFLIGYHGPPGENGWAASPLTALGFFLAYLGAPLGFFAGPWACVALGLALVAGLVLAVRYAGFDDTQARPWIALAAFALAAAALETIGRSGNGIEAALAMRYTTTSTLAWIALVALTAFAPIVRASRFALACGSLCLATAYLAGYIAGYGFIGLQRGELRAITDLPRADEDELGEYFNDPTLLPPWVSALRERGLGPFAGAPNAAR